MNKTLAILQASTLVTADRMQFPNLHKAFFVNSKLKEVRQNHQFRLKNKPPHTEGSIFNNQKQQV